jgi:hypothetical protein
MAMDALQGFSGQVHILQGEPKGRHHSALTSGGARCGPNSFRKNSSIIRELSDAVGG